MAKRQFSMLRMMVVTTIAAAAIAFASTFAGPPGAILMTVVSFSLGLFVLLTEPPAWFRFFVPLTILILSIVIGTLLYRSPLPGLIVGVVAGLWIGRRVMRADSNRGRLRAAIRDGLLFLFISSLPFLVQWKHHLAVFKLWSAGATVLSHQNEDYRPRFMRGESFYTITSALGPYIYPFKTSVRFRDDPVRWGGIEFNDEKLAALGPYVENLTAVDDIVIVSDAITDKGVEELANARSLTSIEIVSKEISTEGLRPFAGSKTIDSVLLRCPKVDDSIVEVLRSFPELWCLYLDETSVSDAATKQFADFPKLRQFMVPESTSDETLEKLRETIRYADRVKKR